MDQTLRDRRGELERRWKAGVAEQRPVETVRSDVRSSWERSATAVRWDVGEAPVSTSDDVGEQWAQSRLGRASRVILDDLRDLATQGDLMAAITDDTVTIAWAAGGRTMARRAERVNFSLGGCWAEGAVGTNALALARDTARPATVFSAEHYAPIVHDWVCYSAPIFDAASGEFQGVVDLSTTWQRANQTLLTTVGALARCVEYELGSLTDGGPSASGARRCPGPVSGPLALTTLGSPEVRLGQRMLAVTRRQLELLTVLALHPEGLTLGEVTALVYGDHLITRSTVKAELSHLRNLVGGRVGSRPYRLLGPVTLDVHELSDALEAGDLRRAVELYRGPLLTASDSPEIDMWRHHLFVAVRDAVLSAGQPDLLFELSGVCADDTELHEAAVGTLEDGDPRRSIAAGRLAAAGR